MTTPLSERMADRAVRVGVLSINPVARTVRVGGRLVLLTNTECRLLWRLASDPERVFTREQLLRDVWGFQSPGKTRTLDSHATRLRSKLTLAGADTPLVVNVWGVGYRLTAPAEIEWAAA